MRSKLWGRWARRVISASIIGFLALQILVYRLYQFPADVSSQNRVLAPLEWGRQDVVICLAGAGGRIPLAARVWADLARADRATAPKLYWSGVGPKSELQTLESQYPLDLTPRPTAKDIILESLSRDTVENMEWIVRLASIYRWKNIVLVTSRYHLKRSQFLLDAVLQRQGAELVVRTVALDSDPFVQGNWILNWSAFRLSNIEAMKFLYYRFIWVWLPTAMH